MARELKDSQNASTDGFLKDVLNILGESREEARVYNYDHCRSPEELRFEILADLLRDGYPRKKAEWLATEMAEDLWQEEKEPE